MENVYVKKPGRFWIENKLVEDHLDKISGNELKVLLIITRHFNYYGKSFPSIRRMHTKLNLHHTTIAKCLKGLEKQGYLEKLRIKKGFKIRYIFSKTARYLLPGSYNPLAKPDTKEEYIKEEYITATNVNDSKMIFQINALDRNRQELAKKMGVSYKLNRV